MNLRRLALLSLPAAALLIGGAAPRGYDWNNAISAGPQQSHVIGNPKAKLRLTVYSSYTCTECAAFAVHSEAAMRLQMIASGKVSLELRPILQSPVDLTVAMLAECGDPARFYLRHTGFLRRQASWITPLARASDSQQQRWRFGSVADRNRAVASDFRFHGLMEGMGIDRSKTDRCLTDAAMANRIMQQSDAAQALGLGQAPAFALNGALQRGITSWVQLRPLIDKALKEP